MRTINFKVTFLSDIVLHASSNTEGNIETLDYITGASFLGMVAKNYDQFKDTFGIFHSAKVRFGEATPYFENKPTYKVPFCFFSPKLDSDKKEVRNNHFIDYDNQAELDKQYKQIRSGYITSNLDYINLDYNYSQKAAYDKDNRKSKDSSMFGYKAIKKGTTWKFSIKFADIDEKAQNQVIENILGEKYLGKSKTAQYGKVLIEELKDYKEENLENFNLSKTTYVYINSTLALFDENGMPTFEPTVKNLGLKDASIDWEKTQIRTKKFTPYNFKRQTNDYTRLVIEKGSVIALKDASNEDINIIKNGIGGYLNEGYGEVLINPSFLLKEGSFSLNKIVKENKRYEVEEKEVDNTLISFLQNKIESKNKTYSLGEEVQKFIDKHKKDFEMVSKSQWGQIRMIVQFYKDDYKNKILEFITKIEKKEEDKKNEKLTPKKHWEKGFDSLKRLLDDEKKDIEFIKLLSMMMPKVKIEDEKNDK
ncbi:hypothetical protein [Aliarcobacter cryaerophilus]|uniref:hypothetical protein n=1 Tax=Aliarcobacter cryaerophilus TaxID=28198 RepID=UPI0021B5CD11|nr:hypothetical protein [Aliarcobacter cryaerophilus]MCT7492288.1 hypothetical protein [Aliarcobacter cryaerophilus]